MFTLEDMAVRCLSTDKSLCQKESSGLDGCAGRGDGNLHLLGQGYCLPYLIGRGSPMGVRFS